MFHKHQWQVMTELTTESTFEMSMREIRESATGKAKTPCTCMRKGDKKK